MTVQAIALITITDRETLSTYRDKAAEALARHGGSLIVVDPDPQVLEAAGEKPDIAALMSFPNLESARAWREDPDLAATHALRNKGGKSTIVMLPG
ncbi:DUF1330 domain-containing protein [Labrenzia sp. OB1]|uniref:DUF1330 domain-containing protein n=1 Tax=Labrenzia sp. OB1 TaxID=1561204 RepID=UPI0007B1A5AC|nr:DUF1330 domain-containing protein [Labrenzia sp. OB1]KZM47522.1 hypothetical protein OA90_25285 [Labrenzia sp. OB1]